MKKRNRIYLLPMLAAVVVSACATPIATIEEQPGAYAGRTITVRGIVVDSFSVPGIDLSFYSLSDGTARMPVLAREPREEGEEVRVDVRVVAIAGEAAAEEAAQAVRELADYLAERDIVARSRARSVSRRVIQGIRTLGRGVSGSYLLVETRAP